jgi:alkanesulfonate monooxygenase SsuD/methylene tetrahydromethanopterin reductase-like flavin-dependent oxidoreductase (luciferase family)
LKFGIFDHLDRGGVALDALFRQRLDCVEMYDRLGFYCYHLAEHHGTPLGMASSPGMFLSAVAQRTTRLRFGPLVYLLPLYHPIRLAEEIAMLDQLGCGRLDVGVGRGRSPIELRNFGRDPATTAEVFDEALDIIRRALADGHVDFTGRHFALDDVIVETRPFQQPYPPFWYGIGSPESVDWCIERGFNIVTNAKPAIAAQIAERFRASARATNDGLLLGMSRFVVVSDTTAKAVAVARRAYANWFASFNALNVRAGAPPAQQWQLQNWHPAFDGMAADGVAVAGRPDQVVEALRTQLEATGIRYFVGQFVFGDMTVEESCRSIELFGGAVMPALERLG